MALLKNDTIRLLRRSLSYFLPYKMLIIASFAALGVVALSTAGAAYLVQPALDEIFIKKDQTALVFLPFLLVAVFLAKGIGLFIQKFLMSYCGTKVLEQLRYELFAKIICLPLDFFGETRVGMLMSRIISDVNLISASLPELIRIIQHSLTMVGLIGLVLYRDAQLAFWACLVFPLAVYPVIYFGKKLRKIGRKYQSELADISSHLQESFNGLRVVKAFASEELEKDKFRIVSKNLARIGIKGKMYNQLSSPIMELIGAIGAGLVIWYGGSQVIAGNRTPGEFFSFMTALIMLYDPFKSISQANNTIQQAMAGAERVFEILDSKDLIEEKGGDIEYTPPFASLAFENVTFFYPGTTDPALKNINLTIKAGERLAFVGQSGAGKTTIAHLVPRFHDCTQGTIRLNNRPLSEYTLASLRSNIGIVSQDPFLFNLSVRDNIAYGQSSTDQALVEQAAIAAYAHDFIKELPHGYETIVGEKGVKLSGGQKQRLTIARAIMKNPSLLILDEATSALDTESERIVQKALENLMEGRTSIVIAHRLSTVLSADRIIVMQNGKIISEGTNDQLLQTCPFYSKLYKLQFEGQK
ncbi:subfamily B ATP-binding cassette protein MsbA [Desulfomicrobium macestii]|uniref:Subfamily B ATP-binding cassette protein MsbA n=1 Tax=Desulfomicrobium macestii TaxID=90731 RepID=A0ABR9H6N1_9BACT|nr:ABC transporter transmembrane domain-containing protein [Desulfomicrobium macestii]MBE1426360.1 subfamily B ATP-binding cassette protein MsbA [Desulfomicrobium macestii]